MSQIVGRFMVGATVAVLAAVLAPAVQETAAADLAQTEDRALQKEIAAQERAIRDFTALIGKLERTERESSSSGRRRALSNLSEAMGAVIVTGERKLGEEYVITQHGEEVSVVRTDEIGAGRGVNTRKRVVPPPGANEAPPVAYFHLVRQQAIYVSCRTIQEQAANKQGEAFAQYRGLAKEFAELMRRDLAELRADLAHEPAAATASVPEAEQK